MNQSTTSETITQNYSIQTKNYIAAKEVKIVSIR